MKFMTIHLYYLKKINRMQPTLYFVHNKKFSFLFLNVMSTQKFPVLSEYNEKLRNKENNTKAILSSV